MIAEESFKKIMLLAPPRATRLLSIRLGLVAAIAASWIACAPLSAQERVRLALSVRNVVFLPFYYAKDARIFEKHGMNVELIQMRSDLQVVGLISGEIDYIPAIGPATVPIASGAPLKVLATMYKAPLFSLAGQPNLTNVNSLEGKRVAVSRIGSELRSLK